MNQVQNQYITPKIQCVIRKRPMNKKELDKNEPDIIQTPQENSIIVRELKQKVDLTKYIEEHQFNFDRTFNENDNNEKIYQSTVKPLIDSAFNHYKVTVFAYGQTGSGKTYTMLGDLDNNIPGLYLLASYDIFNYLELPQYSHLSCWVSFYEIYCGKLYDLLNERKMMQIREDQKSQINIVGVQEKRITSVQSLMQLIEFGSRNRITGVNSANTDSSRSHAILQINLRENENIFGKMSFIDLAGSERGADVSGSDKQTRVDGAEINKSLLALKECIRALDLNKNYLPFRGSKLTLVLKDSFIGDCKTVMIGNIGPSLSNCEHTLNTLRYADRVKELKNPRINKQISDLEQLSKELMLSRQNNNIVQYDLKKKSQFEVKLQENQGQQPEQNKQNNSGQHINSMIESQYNISPPRERKLSSQLNSNNLQFNKQDFQQPSLGQRHSVNITQSNYYKDFQNGNFRNQFNTQSQQHFQSQYLYKPAFQPSLTSSSSQIQQKLFTQTGTQNRSSTLSFNQINQGQQYQQEQQNNNNNINGVNQQNRQPSEMYASQNNYVQPIMNKRTSINPELNQNHQNIIQQNKQQLHEQQQNENDLIYMNFKQMENQEIRTENDLDLLTSKHEQLIGMILAEEEQVVSSHRYHIDDNVELVKSEMMLLNEVEKPGSHIDEYLENLEEVLDHKAILIADLKTQIKNFKQHLILEEQLSQKFHNAREKFINQQQNQQYEQKTAIQQNQISNNLQQFNESLKQNFRQINENNPIYQQNLSPQQNQQKSFLQPITQKSEINMQQQFFSTNQFKQPYQNGQIYHQQVASQPNITNIKFIS